MCFEGEYTLKTIIVYSSKTGYTRKYAQWLKDEIQADIVELSSATYHKLKSYDRLIYGGGLYASGINGLKKFKKLIVDLVDKRVLIYATGVCPGRDEQINEMKNVNFSDDELSYIDFFYLRGGFNFELLGFIDKTLMGMLKKKIEHKSLEELTPDDKGMLAVYDNPTDFSKKEYLQPILEHINNQDVLSMA